MVNDTEVGGSLRSGSGRAVTAGLWSQPQCQRVPVPGRACLGWGGTWRLFSLAPKSRQILRARGEEPLVNPQPLLEVTIMSSDPSKVSRQRRSVHAIASLLGVGTVGGALLSSAPTLAWEPLFSDASCTGGGAHLSGPAEVVVHISEMDGFDLAQTFQALDAFVDVHAVVSAIADTSLEITSVRLSSEPFTFKDWYGDVSPTIRVGFNDTVAAASAVGNRVAGSCTYDEAHVQIRNESVYDWAYLEPAQEGVPFWDAGKTLAGDHSFRLMYLHELFHAFGVAHSDHSFSIMNKGARPWHNRAAGEQFQPLPDDVEAARALYPGSRGDTFRIALLNTWHDVNDPEGDAVQHKMLCQPSRGSSWADPWDATRLGSSMAADDGLATCGVALSGVATEVCPGDVVRTQVAVANYHASEVDVALRLWFSSDDVWDGVAGGDVKAAEVRRYTQGPQGSSKQGRVYTVPALPEGEYHLISKGVATDVATGDKTNDWIPLRGTLTVLPPDQCGGEPEWTAEVLDDPFVDCRFNPCDDDPRFEDDTPDIGGDPNWQNP